MKKIIFIFIACVSFLSANAQFEKGTHQLGFGGLPIIYFGSSNLDGFSLRANYGYFLTKKLSAGVTPFWGKVDEMSSFGANLYLRYYYFNAPKLSLFVETNGGFGKLEYEVSSAINGTMSTISIGPGIHCKVKNNLSIEFLVQYARLRNISFPENTLVGNTLIPTIGLQYFIGK